MPSSFQSLTINDTGNLTVPNGTQANRPNTTTTIVKWTNTGTQAVSVLTGSATTTTTSWTCPSGVTSIEVLVVAGGGGGGISYPGNTYSSSGGGGAGGVLYSSNYSVTSGTSYTVTVGAGGAAAFSQPSGGGIGSNSVFATLTAIGGGGGGGAGSNAANTNGGGGGSGGGGSGGQAQSFTGGTGTAGQGFAGGTVYANVWGGSGGGGAGSPGYPLTITNGQSPGYRGGEGLTFSITGNPLWYAGGGGGGGLNSSNTGGAGGAGGGGTGGYAQSGGGANLAATAGTASTGGGGGGGTYVASSAGAGGSGVVIIRYNVTSSSTMPTGQVRFNTNTLAVESFTNNNQWSQLSNGLVLHLDPGSSASYPGTGTTITDLSGCGNTGTLYNSVGYSSSNSGYLTYNGSTQYMKIPMSPSIASCTTGVTMSIWVNQTSLATQSLLLNNHIQGASYYGPTSGLLMSINTNGQWFWQMRVNNNCCQTAQTAASVYTANTWVNLIGTWDNGVSTAYQNNAIIAPPVAVSGVLPMINDFYFGMNADTYLIPGGGQVNMFVGNMGPVFLWNRALTPAEINQHFQTYRGRYGI